jgi:translation initiation factor IF-2
MMTQMRETGRQEVPALVKADVQGSAEAIIQALDKLGTDEVRRASSTPASAASPNPTSSWPRPRTR